MVDAYCVPIKHINKIDNSIRRYHHNYHHHNYHHHHVYMMSDSFMSFGNHMIVDIKLPTREKRVGTEFLKSPKKILGTTTTNTTTTAAA